MGLRVNPLGVAAYTLLWFILLNELRVEWTANPQYSYGWVVPLLSLGLLLRRWSARPRALTLRGSARSGCTPRPASGKAFYLFLGCAAAILPLRLLLEATPGWRSLGLLLGCSTVALSLLGVYVAAGRGWAWHLAFPICFILLAVPWPVSVEIPLIQGLTRANVASTIECLGWFGIPASQHGNLIEISTGVIGINDACSGIRSFQASLMISLFLGEFFRLGLWRRVGLSLAGVSMAFLFNICRTSFMVALASKRGIAASERWHDPAGLSISLACLLGLWGLSLLLKKSRSPGWVRQAKRGGAEVCGREPARSGEELLGVRDSPRSLSGRLALLLLGWLVLVEGAVEIWYRAHESGLPAIPEWTLRWPPAVPGFQEQPVPEVARQMLKYDEGHWGTWHSADGFRWSLAFFRWQPGKIALAAARSHSPEICLAAVGKDLLPLPDNRCPLRIGSLVFPFRRYQYADHGQTIHVFHCLWEEHAPGRYFSPVDARSQVQLNLRAALAGRRNLGQRSVEIVVIGLDDPVAAQTAVLAQLEQIICVKDQGKSIPVTALRCWEVEPGPEGVLRSFGQELLGCRL